MKFEVEGSMPKPKMWLTDQEYRFVHERAVRHCIDFVVVQQGKVLLVVREIEPFRYYWSLPGGSQRIGEPEQEARARLLFKELGVTTSDERKLVDSIEHLPDGPWHSVSLAFLIKNFEGQLRGNSEGRQFEFFSEIPPNTQPYQAAFLRKYWADITA